MEVKDIIKNRRLELNMTLLDIAKKVGVSEATVSRWESGDIANMKRDKIALLAKALEISPSVIMGWDESIYEPIKTIGYHEQEISPFIDVDAIEAAKRWEGKKVSKQNEENSPELDDLDKTMLSLFQSLSIIEKCEIITQLKKKST